MSEESREMIHHPQHYGGDTIYETIKVIEAWQLGFNLGNAVKYISRAGKKGDRLEDLKKARFYLEREIGTLESTASPPAPWQGNRCPAKTAVKYGHQCVRQANHDGQHEAGDGFAWAGDKGADQ